MNKPKESATLMALIIDKAEYEKESAVRDMLTDLMHYCDTRNISFHNELHIAAEHYKAEKKGE
jgi:hypothetical protein